MQAETIDHDTYGVLVGWKHQEFAGKLDLSLQTKTPTGRLAKGDVETFHIVMTPQQATILANYLITITGSTPPPPRKGRFQRWLGL